MKTIFDSQALGKAAAVKTPCDGLEIPELEMISEALIVTSISMVGFDNCFKEDGRLSNPSDLTLLRKGLATLARYSIALAPDLKAHLINGHRDHGGRDFFKEQQNLEVLFLSAIYFPDDCERVSNDYIREDSPLLYMSPEGTSRRAWVEKSEALGVQLIFSDSYGECITIEDFPRWGNFTVLKTDQGFLERGCAISNQLLTP